MRTSLVGLRPRRFSPGSRSNDRESVDLRIQRVMRRCLFTVSGPRKALTASETGIGASLMDNHFGERIDVSLQVNKESHQDGEGDAVEKDVSEDGPFVAVPIGGG